MNAQALLRTFQLKLRFKTHTGFMNAQAQHEITHKSCAFKTCLLSPLQGVENMFPICFANAKRPNTSTFGASVVTFM